MIIRVENYFDEYGEYVVKISTKISSQEEDEKLRIALQKFLEGYTYENGNFRKLQLSTDS